MPPLHTVVQRLMVSTAEDWPSLSRWYWELCQPRLAAERGLRTAIGAREGFGKLLAAGLAFSIGLQIFVVVGGLTRVIPLTGLTTPFLSAGGSSLIANWIIIALLMRISDHARRPVAERVTDDPELDTPTHAGVAP